MYATVRVEVRRITDIALDVQSNCTTRRLLVTRKKLIVGAPGFPDMEIQGDHVGLPAER